MEEERGRSVPGASLNGHEPSQRLQLAQQKQRLVDNFDLSMPASLCRDVRYNAQAVLVNSTRGHDWQYIFYAALFIP